MGMFLIPKGATVLGIKNDKEWRPENFKECPTKEAYCFDKAELIIDPTGIASYANGPGNVTVGSAWAEAGYYGFRPMFNEEIKGWTMLVHSKFVQYG